MMMKMVNHMIPVFVFADDLVVVVCCCLEMVVVCLFVVAVVVVVLVVDVSPFKLFHTSPSFFVPFSSK